MEQWVKDKKEEAMRRRLERQPGMSYVLPPMAFTGAGKNGIVEPGRSAGMDTRGQPFYQHEGELKANMPEGTFVLNEPTTRKAYPGMVYPTFEAGGFNEDKPIVNTPKTFNAPVVEPMKVAPITGSPTQQANQPKAETPQTATGGEQTTTTGNPYNPGTKEAYYWEQANQPKQTLPEEAPPGETPPEETPPEEALLPGSPIDRETEARNAGLEYQLSLLNQTNPAAALESRKNLDELSARHQQEKSALEQRLIQQGVDPGQARVEAQMLRNQQESELNDLAAQYGIAGMQARERTAETLASQGLAGQQFQEATRQWNATFAEDVRRYGNTEGWRAYEAAIAAGDFDTAAEAYKSVTGRTISTEQMQTYQNYLNTKRQQDITTGEIQITSGEIANEAAALGVDANRLTTFINAVNNGADLAAANAASGLNLTQPQMDGITEQYRQSIEASYLANMQTRNNLSNQQMEAIVYAINHGATRELVNERFGIDLTNEEFARASNQYTIEVEKGYTELARQRTAWGDEIFNSVQNLINGGAGIETINRVLRENGQPEITVDEFQSARNATQLGQREWERNLTAANMLLQTNDPTNIAEAGRQFEELFPGVAFNFDQLISDVGAERFASGMNDLAKIAATFDTWDEASRSATGLKLVQNLGIMDEDLKNRFDDTTLNTLLLQIDVGKTREQIIEDTKIDISENEYAELSSALMTTKTLFEGLKINAIDEEWSTIEDSQWFIDLQNTDPNAADMVRQTFSAGLTGELEFDITPVYNIVDNNGDFVKAFNNITDANSFLGENADAGYTIEKKSNYIYKDLTTGDTVVVNNGTGEATTGGETTETVKTIAAKFAKAGLDYTEEDVQAYYDANGRLPIDSAEMKSWDEKQYNMQFWNKFESNYPDGTLSSGETPSISQSDIDSLISAKNEGDKRAEQYFLTDQDMSQIKGFEETFKNIYDTAVSEKRNPPSYTAFKDAVRYMKQMLDDNQGKIIMLNETPYVILGTQDKKDGTTFTLYNTKTKKTDSYYMGNDIRNGLESIVK